MTTLDEKKIKGEILNLSLKNIILIGTIMGTVLGAAAAMLTAILLKG